MFNSQFSTFIVAAYYTPFPARLLMFYLEHNGHEEGTKVTTPTRKVSERGDAPCNPVINSAELCGLKKVHELIRFRLFAAGCWSTTDTMKGTKVTAGIRKVSERGDAPCNSVV